MEFPNRTQITGKKETSLGAFANAIRRLIKERASIIWIKSCDKEYIFEILKTVICDEAEASEDFCIETNRVTMWNVANGSVGFDQSSDSDNINSTLGQMLRVFKSDKQQEILILDDISSLILQQENRDEIIGLFQEFAYRNTKWKNGRRRRNLQPLNEKSIIIISPRLEIVDNLKHLVDVVEEPIPDVDDIMHELGFDRIEQDPSILKTKIRDKSLRGKYEYGRYKFSGAFMRNYSENSKKLVSALHGMYLYQIRRLLYSLQIHSDSNEQILILYESISGRDLNDFISDEKKRLVQNSGLLQVIDMDYNLQKDRIGNINNLRKFLYSQKAIIDNIENYNQFMPRPKGVLLVGAPGCGKSEAAKSVAAIFEKPLLRLDIGALMGQYVGVSEHNLIEAIRIAEAAAPCVLWIDEIEKAFAGFDNSDSGNDITVMRMVGYFLTWMQERKSMVYLVATANRLENLRPELLRKGRWDKIMYLSYPDKKGIVDIFNKCLNKYRLKLDVSTETTPDGGFQDNRFARMVQTIYEQEMSGADIDSIVVEAYNSLFTSPERRSEINAIRIEDCLRIAESANILSARKEADDESVAKSIREYKISHSRFDWDMDRNARYDRAIAEYRISSGASDYDSTENELVEEAINDLKISSGNSYLSNESEIRKLIVKKIKRSKSQTKKMEALIKSKIDAEEKEREIVSSLLREQLSHKNREEQEKYYRSKGYESAS